MKNKLHYYFLAFFLGLSLSQLHGQRITFPGSTTISCSSIGTAVGIPYKVELDCRRGTLSSATAIVPTATGTRLIALFSAPNSGTVNGFIPVTFPSVGTYTIRVTASQICGRFGSESQTNSITVNVGLPRPFRYPNTICGGERNSGPFPSTGSFGRTTIFAPGPITNIRRLYPTPNSLPISNTPGSSVFTINTSTYCGNDIRLEVTYTFCGIAYTEDIRIRVECCIDDDVPVMEDVIVENRSSEISDIPNIILKPNPVVEYMELENIDVYKNYSIFSLSGHLVQKGDIVAKTIKISTAEFESGMYFVVLRNEQETKSIKFVKR